MAQLTMADLKDYPSSYDSTRDVGDVLIGEDAACLVLQASSSGNDTALQSLLSQPHLIKTMLEKPHCIYYEHRARQGSNDERRVMAAPTSNVERALAVATQNGHADIVSALLAFAKHQGIDTSVFITRSIINKTIGGGHAAVYRALASADASVINFPLPHGALPLYEAVRLRKPDVAAVLLELGADPLHPVRSPKTLASYHSSLLSHAAFGEGPRTTEMLLKYGTPIAGTGALHTAAGRGQLDTMRLLMQHDANVNETLDNWRNRTPMHFAALEGHVEAMKLLEEHGAGSDIQDGDGKTPAQLLEEHNTA